MKTKILKAALFTPLAEGRWGLPLLLWSVPGEAKSAMVRLVCAEWGLCCKVLPPGQVGEGMFGVVPFPVQTERGARMTYPSPAWVDDFEAHGGRGVVFPDETNTVPPALQAAVMGLINDRRIGDALLPLGVRALGAANPTACAAGGWDLSAPMANRFGHLAWDGPSAEEWADWLITGADGYQGEVRDAAAEEARVLAAWPGAFAQAAGLTSGFLRRNPGLRHKMPQDGDPAQSRAWPSPRTWEMATRALASAKVHGLTAAETDEFMAAFVGGGAATEFAAWQENLDLPDPAQVLDGAVEWRHDPKRLDRSWVVLGSCAATVAAQNAPKRKERAAKLWSILAEVCGKKDAPGSAPDVTIPAVRALVHKEVRLGGMPEARPVLVRLQPMLAAAGITAQ